MGHGVGGGWERRCKMGLFLHFGWVLPCSLPPTLHTHACHLTHLPEMTMTYILLEEEEEGGSQGRGILHVPACLTTCLPGFAHGCGSYLSHLGICLPGTRAKVVCLPGSHHPHPLPPFTWPATCLSLLPHLHPPSSSSLSCAAVLRQTPCLPPPPLPPLEAPLSTHGACLCSLLSLPLFLCFQEKEGGGTGLGTPSEKEKEKGRRRLWDLASIWDMHARVFGRTFLIRLHAFPLHALACCPQPAYGMASALPWQAWADRHYCTFSPSPVAGRGRLGGTWAFPLPSPSSKLIKYKWQAVSSI